MQQTEKLFRQQGRQAVAFAIIGAILLLLKLFEVKSFGDMSWWWIIVPFAIAFFYWEVIEPMFNLRAKNAMKKEKEESQKFKKKQLDDIYKSGRANRKYRVMREGQQEEEQHNP